MIMFGQDLRDLAHVVGTLKKHLAQQVEEAKIERGGTWRLSFRKGDTARNPEILDELLVLWGLDSAFILTCVVNTPYSGCWHESQMYLVTPPGCEELTSGSLDPEHGECVWPLYASGQGVYVDGLKSFLDLATWISDQSLYSMATRDGDAGSARLHASKESMTGAHGSFDSFAVHAMGPVNLMGPHETYWANAVRIAEREYNIMLPWTCGVCGQVQEGAGESQDEPIHTGYRGNWGIGVFMEGAICQSCCDEGMCSACAEIGCAAHEAYDPDVAQFGWHLCEWHTEELCKLLTLTWEEGAVPADLPDTVHMMQYVEPTSQLPLPALKLVAQVRLGLFTYVASDKEEEPGTYTRLPIQVGTEDIAEALESVGLCYASDYIDGVYGQDSYWRGIQLPGHVMENCVEEIEETT